MLTTFWWDNFDRNIETASGAGSIHNTTGIMFQEESACTVNRNENVSIPKSKRRSVRLEDVRPIQATAINPKKDPPSFADKDPVQVENHEQMYCNNLLIVWKSLRHLTSLDQVNPRFVGWVILFFETIDSKQTKLTYLPPIQKPITDYATLFEMFRQSRELARKANMKYIHITPDVGAAIKAYHVIWNNPNLWSDIIIRLGDFHAINAYFGAIGTFVSGSGFEDILFQAGLCSAGSLNGLLSEKHYNRCWLLHESFSEPLIRLFQEQYVPEIPDSLINFAKHPPGTVDIEELLADPSIQAYLKYYVQQVKKCLNGEFGKTPQFWVMYMIMVDRQQKLHYSINTNNYNLRLLIWKESLPMWFATNKIHYAHHGTFYVKFLEYLEDTHPGAKEEIEEKGLSLRRNTLGIGQAVDMAGEQSYMKSAKTAGGIRQFSTNEAAVAKWVMNRPFQARFAETLMEISGRSKTTSSSRKCLRPSEILKSEKMVKNILDALQIQFLNPLHQDIEKPNLYNLVSGRPVNDAICDSLLGFEKDGIGLMESFEERLTTDPITATFFSSLKRNKYKSWKGSTKKLL